MRVAGRRVLITGAGHGLGKALAAAFTAAGAAVVATDRDADRLERVVAELGGGSRIQGYPLDVTAPEQIVPLRERLNAEHGPIDILINNAGVVFGGRFDEVPLEHHQETLRVNLGGVLAVTHAFLPGLIARPAAQIVNMASAAALVALPWAASYAATKWAVLGFSESLREELRIAGHRHVAVTAVCPSFITTGLFDGARPPRLTTWLKPETVARAVVRAVERGQRLVLLPWTVRLLDTICRALPRHWYTAVGRGLGVSTTMLGWYGYGAAKTERWP